MAVEDLVISESSQTRDGPGAPAVELTRFDVLGRWVDAHDLAAGAHVQG